VLVVGTWRAGAAPVASVVLLGAARNSYLNKALQACISCLGLGGVQVSERCCWLHHALVRCLRSSDAKALPRLARPPWPLSAPPSCAFPRNSHTSLSNLQSPLLPLPVKLNHLPRPGLLCRFHVHYDEAFSSLQVPHLKGFCRFHITPSGDLEMYSLGLEKVGGRVGKWQTGAGPGAAGHRADWLCNGVMGWVGGLCVWGVAVEERGIGLGDGNRPGAASPLTCVCVRGGT
jgi:hypothetical protein